MNSAIIVAAGSGKRFGSEKPKQFLDIAGKPLIFHTLERFENCSRQLTKLFSFYLKAKSKIFKLSPKIKISKN